MQQVLEKIAQDAESMAGRIRDLIPQCHDFDLMRLLKKLDAEMMDMMHNIQLARRLAHKDGTGP